MNIKVLGALHAEVKGVSIVPTARKPRQILALLALRPGRVVPVSTLTEEIWGADQPQSSLTALQTYILQLRRMLRTAMGPEAAGSAKDMLATRYGGYLLQISPQAVDVYRYDRLVAEGQRAFESGDDARTASLLREALALWEGPPLADVQVGAVLELEVMRLEQSRLVTSERRIDAELRLGRHTELVAGLTDLIARHPQHEGLHAQAMVALYRSGRRANALNVYRRLRQRLDHELGVEPSPQLQRMYQAMLSVDPRLDIVADSRGTSTFDLYATRR
ncbi:AfsR/SARP family transcriptional regulator [Streptomyces sp. KMM 9044]|uniref:AfsR/SARP family transcriptional regulator n=1 Tax=Streptomyces sp. KMM 9044 TaxID=2744474 RepID=UPI00215138B8|nr:AfsR/SARP family transcriptional regulator [Streptomyces sp. KMM 9044]WAX82214.1 AfsR/SARP family transcriptional regulator [Streptomyces sp. KMM 9044]